MASSISKEEIATDIKKITERQKVLFLDILDKECEDYLSVINEKKLKHKETLFLLKLEKYKNEFREEKISDERILKAFESLTKDYMGVTA